MAVRLYQKRWKHFQRQIGYPLYGPWYHPSFTLWFLRRNAILIPIAPDANPDYIRVTIDVN